ncbi:MAG: glycosyltransferase family 2 protein [Candidatus Cloacimonetes bacterium]|nr:glycosyltransferase family 2 protein [Candidatus Cloacimonadota bacterium]
MKNISVIIPVFNDREVISTLLARLTAVLKKLTVNYEIILVDDCSTDDTVEIVSKEQLFRQSVTLIRLKRNFGQQYAITAGIDHASGEIIAVMDSDLQDPPEALPELLEKLEFMNSEIVIARWKKRKSSLCRVILSRIFFLVAQLLTNIRQDHRTGVYRVFLRDVIDRLGDHAKQPGSILSMMHKGNFRIAYLDLERQERFAGKSGYNYNRLIKLAWDRLKNHSIFRSSRDSCPAKPKYEIESISKGS